MLRIVGGTLRGRSLQQPLSSLTRPTSDRGREAIFNILEHRFSLKNGTSPLKNARILDLFAGSGALGFECLSRGSAFCFFLEKDPHVLSILTKNRENLAFENKSSILSGDIVEGLTFPSSMEFQDFDVIFLDPPYGKGYVYKTLNILVQKKLFSSSTLFVAELGVEEDISDIEKTFTILEKRSYGRAQFLFGKFKL